MRLDERYLFRFFTIQRGFLNFLALATPHQPRFAQQLPPGGSQELSNFWRISFIEALCCVRRACAAAGGFEPPEADATERFVEWKSPKTSEFRRGRQLGDPSGFAAGGRLISRPYRCGGNREPTETHEVHPLSFAFAQQLPQRWSQGHFVPAGRLLGDPY